MSTFCARLQRSLTFSLALLLLLSLISCQVQSIDSSAGSTSTAQTSKSSPRTSYNDGGTTADQTPKSPETDTPVTTTAPVTTAPVTTAPITTAPPAVTVDPTPFENQPCSAKYVLLYDLTADQILYTTGNDQIIYPASITKIFTLLYARTFVNEDTIFTVGDELKYVYIHSSFARINKGERYTFRDIAAAMLLPSGNDAAYTLAANCGKILAGDDSLPAMDAIELFMNSANNYAESIGLTHTHFVTPDGLHDPEHYTTLGEMLEISRMVYADSFLSELMGMATYDVCDLDGKNPQTWKNSNALLQEDSNYYYPYATGGKTGFHDEAGGCLVATAEKDGRELMVLIFKAADKNARAADALAFLKLGFTIEL